MPVRIEQPAPMAPDITAGGGAAAQFSRDLPSLAGLYEAAGRNATQAGIAGTQASSHYAAARLSAETQMQDAQARQDEQRRQFDLSRMPSDRDAYLGEQHAALANQHAQNQAWLQQQDLSQAEVMRMQRMQNSVGALKEAHENGSLTDQQYNDAVTQVRTGLDPLRQRMEAMQAKQMQSHIQASAHTQAQQDAADKIWADQAKNGVLELPDGRGGTMKIMRQPNGNYFQPKESPDAQAVFLQRYNDAAKALTHKDDVGNVVVPTADQIGAHMQAAADAYNKLHPGYAGDSTQARQAAQYRPLSPVESAKLDEQVAPAVEAAQWASDGEGAAALQRFAQLKKQWGDINNPAMPPQMKQQALQDMPQIERYRPYLTKRR